MKQYQMTFLNKTVRETGGFIHHYLLTTCFILLSLFATAQTKVSSLSNNEWLQMITANAIKSPGNSPVKAPPGYALYFSQAGAINVPYLVYVPMHYDPTHAH